MLWINDTDKNGLKPHLQGFSNLMDCTKEGNWPPIDEILIVSFFEDAANKSLSYLVVKIAKFYIFSDHR